MSNLSKKFQTIMLEIACMFLEREEQLLAITRAMLAGEHVLLLGVPGTAKSATIVEFCRRITGAKYFETLLTKFSGMEEVFGPLDIPGLQVGKYERLIEGYLPWAHVGFIDEVWKANSAILNALLTITNERKFKQGPINIATPLVSLVCASNETPQESELTALYDRFMVRKMSDPVSDHSFVNLLDPDLGKNAGNTVVTLAEWEQARAEVKAVKVPLGIREEIASLKVALHRDGFIASDRRWRASVKLLQACAYLDGRDTVESDDLMVYCDVLWNEMKQAKPCAAKVGDVVNPALSKLLEHIDEIDKLLVEFTKGKTENDQLTARMKINTHKESIKKISGRVGKKGEEALARIQEKEKAAVRKVMGLE